MSPAEYVDFQSADAARMRDRILKDLAAPPELVSAAANTSSGGAARSLRIRSRIRAASADWKSTYSAGDIGVAAANTKNLKDRPSRSRMSRSASALGFF